MNKMKVLTSTLLALFFVGQFYTASSMDHLPTHTNTFLGMWTLEIEDGTVGWLHVHENEGYLDAELLWKGGSVVPVSHVYSVDDYNMVATRTAEVHKNREEGKERKHIITYTLNVQKTSAGISGTMTMPNRNGMGLKMESFKGTLLPDAPSTPDLGSVKYGSPIQLFNGKDLSGWKLIGNKRKNGFKAVNGELVNDPVQPDDGGHVYYGNLRTEQEFQAFNLKLEVNVPEGNNSGVYLKGMYEVQVQDSYGKDLDSHNMGALYSRITPTVAAEKPGGSWQTLDITLYERHVTIILNGQKIIDNKPIYGPTGGAIIADVFAPGPIYLQGDHGNVKYRNIVLTPIKE
jgi:hypothetical protein